MKTPAIPASYELELVYLAVRVPKSVRQALKISAAQHDVSLQELVVRILTEFLADSKHAS